MIAAGLLGVLVGLIVNEELIPHYAIRFIYLYYFAIIIPFMAVAVRRLHDSDKSGWWMLLLLTQGLSTVCSLIRPVNIGLVAFATLLAFAASVTIIVFLVLPGSHGENRYGANPKHYIITYGRRVWTNSLGLTLIIAGALSFLVGIVVNLEYHPLAYIFSLNYVLSSNVLIYLTLIVAGILLLQKKEQNTGFGILLILAAIFWIVIYIVGEIIRISSLPDGVVIYNLQNVLNKLFIVVPFALALTGLAWMCKNNPDIPIKIKPKFAAVFLAAASLYWIAFKIYGCITYGYYDGAFTNLILPVSFLVLATYMLRRYDALPDENSLPYEKPQASERPQVKNSPMHLAFAIINIVTGTIFLFSSIIALFINHRLDGAAAGIFMAMIVMISLFIWISGFVYMIKREYYSATLRILNIIAVVISFILIALFIIGIIIAYSYN
jgi:uncharacterized membrane protein YhaH (DUF805 family)